MLEQSLKIFPKYLEPLSQKSVGTNTKPIVFHVLENEKNT
jgi:hypothetical protein